MREQKGLRGGCGANIMRRESLAGRTEPAIMIGVHLSPAPARKR